jgi:hypothetical protein
VANCVGRLTWHSETDANGPRHLRTIYLLRQVHAIHSSVNDTTQLPPGFWLDNTRDDFDPTVFFSQYPVPQRAFTKAEHNAAHEYAVAIIRHAMLKA